MELLVCEDLSVGYDGKCVVKNLSFSVEEGDYLAIVGENGAGKSTLMKTLLGLQKPLSGEIRFGDDKRTIGYLPQQSPVQKDFPASVWEVVLSGCLAGMKLRPFYNKSERERAKNNLEKMGLNGFEKRCYRELSGGQQQRVLLARALCATKRTLLLDEPVSGLDPTATKEMYAVIKGLNDEGVTVVMITHDVRETLAYANKVLRLGEEPFFGTKEEFLKTEGKNDF